MKRVFILIALIVAIKGCAAPIAPVPDDGIGGTGIVVEAV